ncbi:single-stranded DNA-binding protein [Vineibacter terrae]|uniref:Single-stranded DNA-binding protein n=1 Tax=Vineibacter terrae TaxID=2586908 RepID=A0A5C8PGP1_9HYPH|nr:single-stranded DNA-binding protein [Vineibacter terrae]TXL72520.1 single-stranded DNA-binding protein [Vineibacter terrae]
MAGSVNRVILIGHLGRDPEVHHTQAGSRIVNMSMATSESWRNKDTGERMERTEWHRVVIFNERLTEIAEKYLRKGSKVYLEGQLATRKWTDQQKVERYTTEVVVPRFGGALVLLDRQQTGPGSPSSPDDYGTTRASGAGGAPAGRDPLDDDVPF